MLYVMAWYISAFKRAEVTSRFIFFQYVFVQVCFNYGAYCNKTSSFYVAAMIKKVINTKWISQQ